MEKTVGIYIHIPFCASRCHYCDFCSLAGCDELMPRYQAALLQHMKEFAPRLEGYLVDSVYFGGGTPSYYGAKRLVKLFDTLKDHYSVLLDAEVTLEANPDSLDLEGLRQLRRAGFNRLSLGVQSANNELLRAIGRRHNFDQAELAVKNARKAGFENISLDLIYGLPGQSRDDWADTLNRAAALKPRHLSCYGLKIEPGTVLHAREAELDLPDDDAQADMYLYTVEALGRLGLRQYEISNFARKGFESRHNLKYWTLQDYVGFGANAASNLGGLRYTYVYDPLEYIDAVQNGGNMVAEQEQLGSADRASEYLMLGLRTAVGVSAEEYTAIYRSSFEPLEALLQHYSGHGWARKLYGRWSLTPSGFLLSNRLIGELLDTQAEQKQTVGSPWAQTDYYQTLF